MIKVIIMVIILDNANSGSSRNNHNNDGNINNGKSNDYFENDSNSNLYSKDRVHIQRRKKYSPINYNK